MRRGALFSIAPHGQFLDLLAARVLDGTLLNGWDRSGPFWLSDVTIILPTRRARLGLAERFAARSRGAALLPDIRTFGGEHAEEEPFLPPSPAPPPPPVAGRLERRLTLSRLVRGFADRADGFASPPNAAEVLRLADSLGELVDDLIIEDVAIERLRELAPEELAAQWQDVVRFLDVALAAWPAILRDRGKIDEATARNDRLRRQAASAALVYGDRPVIAAGSTGSIPATAELMAAVAALPRGVLVLPGLDTTLSPEQHETLLTSEAGQGHPQYGLLRLLRRLGTGVAAVEELGDAAPRTALVRAMLAPAEATLAWPEQRAALPVAAALEGVAVLAARNADFEARAIGMATRRAVEAGRSVGIVSRDQTLARRIAAELSRHGIAVDDPAGTPLYQSAAGRLARQVLAVAAAGYRPVDVVALLRNRAVTLGRDRAEVSRLADRLDLRLRGRQVSPGLAGLLAAAGHPEIEGLLEQLGEALRPLAELCERPAIDAGRLATALREAMAAAGGLDLEGGAEFIAWADETGGLSDPGAPFAPVQLDAVLAALTAQAKVQSSARRRDDVHIWGELEARLQNPDLLILAGLNEDIWPAPADPGPWLSRSMRIAIGLEPPERQQGQAAHDFEMALGNGEVLLAYAERVGSSPALPSRLLQRLDAFIGEAAALALRRRGQRWLEEAAAADFSGPPRPAQRPMPRPPAALRPRRLSITEIEPLMRSPYDTYARHVLHLRRYEPLGAEVGPRERGTMIHAVFEQFVTAGFDFAAPDALAQMTRLAQQAFANLDAIGEKRDIWLERFERAAEQFLDWERQREGEIAERVAESKGDWAFPLLDGFVLVGKADRIDRRHDGRLEILDFKTGGVPAPKDMTAFEAPQLLLEAAMARAGAFPGVAGLDSAALTYLKIGLGPAALQIRPFRLRDGMDLMTAVDEIVRRLQLHVDALLLHDSLAMTARVRPRVETGRKSWPGEFDHLARTDEWTLTAGVDDP